MLQRSSDRTSKTIQTKNKQPALTCSGHDTDQECMGRYLTKNHTKLSVSRTVTIGFKKAYHSQGSC